MEALDRGGGLELVPGVLGIEEQPRDQHGEDRADRADRTEAEVVLLGPFASLDRKSVV